MNKRIPLLLLGLSLLTIGCAKKQSEDNKKPSSLIPDSNTGEVLPSETEESSTSPTDVPGEFTEVEISDTAMYLTVGQTYEFSYISSPSDDEGVVQLKTENASIVSVSGNTATAEAAGSARIYYETPNGLKSYCTVTVLDGAPNVSFFNVKMTDTFEGQVIEAQTGTLNNMALDFGTPSPVEPVITFTATITKTKSIYTDGSGNEIAKEMRFGYRFWRMDGGNARILDNGEYVTHPLKVGETEQVTMTFADFSGGVVGDQYIIQFSNV